MGGEGAVVKNAADEKQVKSGARKEREIRRQQLNDLRAILNTPEGRRFIWRLLSHCQVFNSIWVQSSQIYYNSGKQDVGHFLMAEVVDAKEEALLQMMQEAKREEEKADG